MIELYENYINGNISDVRSGMIQENIKLSELLAYHIGQAEPSNEDILLMVIRLQD